MIHLESYTPHLPAHSCEPPSEALHKPATLAQQHILADFSCDKWMAIKTSVQTSSKPWQPITKPRLGAFSNSFASGCPSSLLEGFVQALASTRFSHTPSLAWPTTQEQTGIEQHCKRRTATRNSPASKVWAGTQGFCMSRRLLPSSCVSTVPQGPRLQQALSQDFYLAFHLHYALAFEFNDVFL